MTINDPSPDTLTHRWRSFIPLLCAMDFRVTGWDGLTLTTSAPLALNRNDKQTGFAGSIAALASVTGWGLTTLIGEESGETFQAAIRDCRQSFSRPIEDDLLARVSVTEEERDRFVAELRERGKARLALIVIIGTRAVPECARLEGTYVAWQVSPDKYRPAAAR